MSPDSNSDVSAHPPYGGFANPDQDDDDDDNDAGSQLDQRHPRHLHQTIARMGHGPIIQEITLHCWISAPKAQIREPSRVVDIPRI